MKPGSKITIKDFEQHVLEISRATMVDSDESVAEKRLRVERLKNNYEEFFEYYFPRYAKSKCAQFHIDLANAMLNNNEFSGIIEWFRGSAKSTHLTIGIPMWLKANGRLKCMLLVGQTDEKANRLLASLQAQLMSNHRYINDFGLQYAYGSWADGEFRTKDGTAFYAIGLGQNPRGTRADENRPDYIVCDDLDSKKLSRNPKLVREAVEWIEDDLMGCFDIGDKRFAFVNNRISKNSILAKLHEQYVLTNPKSTWYYSRVNAIDKRSNPTWPEKYTREYWQRERAKKSIRSWEREYMNNPIEEGTVFKERWINWSAVPALKDYDKIICYCDPSFKNTAHSDYKAIKVWGKRSARLYLIDAFVRKCSVATMVKWFYDFNERLPEGALVDYYIEANMLQDLLIDEFFEEGLLRGYQLPIRKDVRAKPDKFSRIEATSPLYERGLIIYNELKKNDPDFKTSIEQLLAIEQGSHTPDDSPDADEGAIYLLQKYSRTADTNVRIGARHKKHSW